MRVAVAGLGTIGRTLARRLADGVPGLTLASVAARDVPGYDAARLAYPLRGPPVRVLVTSAAAETARDHRQASPPCVAGCPAITATRASTRPVLRGEDNQVDYRVQSASR